MKKVIGVLFLGFVMIATISFAAYPAELEDKANTNSEDEKIPISEESLKEYEVMPISEETMEEFEVIDDDVYKMEDEVSIQEVINGNVYVMAQSVKLDGAIIYGNLYVMAENIEFVNAEIEGSVYALGDKISFSGTANDVYACCSKIDFDLDSFIWRSIRVAGETVNINCNVGRNVYAGVNHLSVGDNAVIEGILNYTAQSEGSISEEAQIQEIQFQQEQPKEVENKEFDVLGYIYEALNVAFRALIVVLIIVFCVNKFKTLKRTNQVAMDLLKDTGKGALVLILVPIISVLLMISLIGIGFGFVLLALYIISFYIATSVTSVEIAHRILSKAEENEVKKGKMIGVSILIAIIIWAIKFIPVLGAIVRFIIVLIGLGILYSLIFQRNKKEEVNEN